MVRGTEEYQTGNVALLRLKEGEDDSCMWHMRCEDSGLKDMVSAALNDI